MTVYFAKSVGYRRSRDVRKDQDSDKSADSADMSASRYKPCVPVRRSVQKRSQHSAGQDTHGVMCRRIASRTSGRRFKSCHSDQHLAPKV